MPPRKRANRASGRSTSTRGQKKSAAQTLGTRQQNSAQKPGYQQRRGKGQTHRPGAAPQQRGSGRTAGRTPHIPPSPEQSAPLISTGSRYNFRTREKPLYHTPQPLIKRKGAERQPRKAKQRAIKRVPQVRSIAERAEVYDSTRAWVNTVTDGEPPEPIRRRSSSPFVSALAKYYLDRGYEPPEEEIMRPTNDDSQPSRDVPSTSQTGRSDRTAKLKNIGDKISRLRARDRGFDDALLERNIMTDASSDPRISDFIKKIEPSSSRRNAPPQKAEKNWRADLLKCEQSNEAIFQRTVMMELINRHELGSVLDFVCEEPWTAAQIPTRNPVIQICQPKPDLAVAFTMTTLMPDETTLSYPLLGGLRGHMCPEGDKKSQKVRAFHFFSVEVKGKGATKENTEAENQNLNTASQALHNIYLFMKEADEVKLFMDRVRIFSAVATFHGFEVRIHRPIEPPKNRLIRSDYKLAFAFDRIINLGPFYTRADVTKIVGNIMSYGLKELHPILKNAVQKVYESRTQGSGSISSTQASNPSTRRSSLSPRRNTPSTRADQDPSPPQASPARKRRAEHGLDESFGSQRRRVDNLDIRP